MAVGSYTEIIYHPLSSAAGDLRLRDKKDLWRLLHWDVMLQKYDQGVL